jgi:hypothetical protein
MASSTRRTISFGEASSGKAGIPGQQLMLKESINSISRESKKIPIDNQISSVAERGLSYLGTYV